VSCWKQSADIPKSLHSKSIDNYLEKSFDIVAGDSSRPYHEVLTEILECVVIEPHLSTTLRKMENGQKCSLRFYPEGAVLKPVGTATGAGFSGDRLGNVVGIMSDIGLCKRHGSSTYTITSVGTKVLSEMRSVS